MAEDLNNDCLGWTLDWLYEHDVTRLFAGLAWRARRAFGVEVGRLHAETTSFSVHGRYALDLPELLETPATLRVAARTCCPTRPADCHVLPASSERMTPAPLIPA
ncbi:MAG TPA: hypothetical protein VF807_07160, partial [Ktedonobacterales bacterium]